MFPPIKPPTALSVPFLSGYETHSTGNVFWMDDFSLNRRLCSLNVTLWFEQIVPLLSKYVVLITSSGHLD